jgi:DNA-binding LytR/AlgR family response regulator
MNTKPFIELPTPQGSEFIDPATVIAIEANNKEILLQIENQEEKKGVKLAFSKAEKLFDHPYFVRCHRSHRVNILKIKEILKKEQIIRLTSGIEVPFSDTYKKQFTQALENYCKKCKGGVNY